MRSLWRLIWLVALVLGSVAVVEGAEASARLTFDYDGQARPTMAYDGPSASPIGYDAARKHATDETRNATTGNPVLFARFAGFLAAEGTMAVSPYRMI